MVLYDMITRKTPYSDCVFPQKIHGLILAGIKPSKQLVDEAETEAKSVQDKSTFFLLKTLMEVCTDNDPNLRPSSEKGLLCLHAVDEVNVFHHKKITNLTFYFFSRNGAKE